MIVDIYTHIFPDRFFTELERGSPKLGNMGKRLRTVRKLFDLDARFRDMDEIGRLPPDHLAAQSADRGHCRRRGGQEPRTGRQRRHGRTVREASRPLPGVRRGGVAARRRGGDRRGRPRHQDGRARRADLHQHRRPPARRAALPAVLCGDGGARSADLAASGAHLGDDRTTPPSRNRASKCGGASAGPTRPRSRCAVWCSTASTTAIPS